MSRPTFERRDFLIVFARRPDMDMMSEIESMIGLPQSTETPHPLAVLPSSQPTAIDEDTSAGIPSEAAPMDVDTGKEQNLISGFNSGHG